MNQPETIETEAVAVLEEQPPTKPSVTAAQAKIEAVAHLTMQAYEKASTLKLSPEEIAALQADFPDEAFKSGAAGKENLIYIEHAYLRDRFNQVLGVGQWTLVPRSRWAEDYLTGNGKQAARVYVEGMLLVRGCFVAEKIGDMSYFKTNDSQNYGDAVEGAQTACLRRCAKELGVGLQAWKKDFCDGWWQRKRGSTLRDGVKTPPRASQTPTKPVSGPAQTTVSESEEDAANRAEFLRVLNKQLPRNAKAGFERWLANVPQKTGSGGSKTLLLPNEHLEDLPLAWLKHFANKLSELAPVVDLWLSEHPENVSQEAQPELPAGPSDPDAKDAPWRSFPVPWGKDAGVPLGELDKKKLYGWWANYTVESEYNGKPKSPAEIVKGEMFRKMLNEAGAHHKFTKDD